MSHSSGACWKAPKVFNSPKRAWNPGENAPGWMSRPWEADYFDSSFRCLAILKRRVAPIASSPSPNIAEVYGSGAVVTLSSRKSESESLTPRFSDVTKKYRSDWLMLIMGLTEPALEFVPCAIAVKDESVGWEVLLPKIANPSFRPLSSEDKPMA